jgi:carboxymethylenebutenolidase
MAQDVSVQVGEDTMKIYVAEPDGEAKGAIVVLQEAFGVNDHIRDLCHRIAEAGYLAAAPHLFHRSGDPELGYDDMMECVPYISGLQVNALEADLAATLELLESKGFAGKKVGVSGWCMGGSVAFLAGAYWELGAAVSWYGGGITQGRFGMPPLIDLAPTLQTPWLGLFGDLDASIPTDQVDALKATAAEKAKVPTDVVRYPEADHGFNCDQRSSHHEASATDGWARMLAFFGEHVG